MDGQAPVFIIGSLRSGGTLLRHLLNTHERLACPPETKFLLALWGMFRYPQVTDALDSLNLPTGTVNRCLREFATGILDSYAASAGKQRWVDRTPSYYRILPFLETIFDQTARYIFLVRHPLDCACSLEEFRLRWPSFETDDPDAARFTKRHGAGLETWAIYWADVYNTVDSFIRSCPVRSHVLRYEDLVMEPEYHIMQILNFLGEDPHLLRIERAFAANRSPGFQDDKFSLTTYIHSESVGCSRRLDGSQSECLKKIVDNAARRFGYQL